MAATYLLPIADREPLAWIVEEQRTAFPEHRAREAAALAVGDILLLYTTRGCFRNPTRDRGRVIGRAVVMAPAERLTEPVVFGGREFPHLVRFRVGSLARLREGVELAPLVPRLRATFPDPETWSVRLRRALVPLAPRDARMLERKLARIAHAYRDARGTYAGASN